MEGDEMHCLEQLMREARLDTRCAMSRPDCIEGNIRHGKHSLDSRMLRLMSVLVPRSSTTIHRIPRKYECARAARHVAPIQ